MKVKLIAVFAGGLLAAVSNASTFSEALDRMEVEDPEFVAFANLENDFSVLGNFLSEAYLSYLMTNPDVPPIPVDFAKLFNNLGLSSMTSVAMASSPFKDKQFRNEVLVEFAESPGGVFLLFGDTNRSFSIQNEAPADADLVAELFFNGEVFYDIIRGIVIDMMGPMGENIIDSQMNNPLSEGGPTLAEVILRMTTRMQVIMKPDFGGEIPNSIPMALAKGKGLVRIEDVADLMDTFSPMLQQAGFVPVEGSDGSTLMFQVQSPEFPVSMYLGKIPETNDLVLSLGIDSLPWYLSAIETVGGTAEFKAFAEALPDEGLSLWYSSRRMAELQIQNLDADFKEDPQMAALFANLKEFLKRYTGGQASVSYLEDDAYRTTSIQPASLKANMGIATVGFSAGIIAAMAETMKSKMPPADDSSSAQDDSPPQ